MRKPPRARLRRRNGNRAGQIATARQVFARSKKIPTDGKCGRIQFCFRRENWRRERRRGLVRRPLYVYWGGVPRLISFRGKTSVGISNLFAMNSVLNQVYRLAVKSQTKDLTDFWKPVRSHYSSSAIFTINFASIVARGTIDFSSSHSSNALWLLPPIGSNRSRVGAPLWIRP